MNSLFDMVLIKEQMKRYWALGVLNFLAYFLFILMPLWTASSNREAQSTVLGILLLQHPLVLILNIIAPLAAASLMFSHMYNPSATVAVYSMPFSKKKLFASNALAGFLLIAIPLLLFSALLLIPKLEYNLLWDYKGIALKEMAYGSTINTFPNIAIFFLRTLLSFTFYYTLFITAAMIVGNQIMHLIVSALLSFIAVIVKFGFYIGASYFIFGYYADSTLLGKILLFTNPILLGAVGTGDGYVSHISMLSLYATYIVIMIALMILSAWLHRKRRLERTADTVVFTPIKHFIVFLVSVTGMISTGVFFFLLLGGGMPTLYAGFIVGFVLSFYIAQMIIEKSFNVLHRMKWIVMHGLAVLAIVSFFNAINVFNVGGYVKYVPKAEDVYGVYLQSANTFMERGANKEMLMQDPEIIDRTISAHKMIIDNRKDLRNAFTAHFTGRSNAGVRTQSITYMLKNGAIVNRDYVLSADIFENSGMRELRNEKSSLLVDIYWAYSPQLIERITMTMCKNEKTETEGKIYDYYNSVSSLLHVNDAQHIEALVAAIKKDYLVSVETVQNSEDKLDFLQLEIYLSGRYEHVGLYYYENTLKCLLENGYSFTSKDGGTEIDISPMVDSN